MNTLTYNMAQGSITQTVFVQSEFTRKLLERLQSVTEMCITSTASFIYSVFTMCKIGIKAGGKSNDILSTVVPVDFCPIPLQKDSYDLGMNVQHIAQRMRKDNQA